MTIIASPFLIVFGLFSSAADLPVETVRPAATSAPAVVAPPTGEGDARGAAREALADGNRKLKAGDVPAAIDAYHRAQTLYPPAAAKIEFNIAKAEEARGDTPAAAAAFERCLAQGGDLPTDFRKEARDQLARLSAGLGTLQVDQKRPGLWIVVDGQSRAKTPIDGGLWVRPGRHTVTLEQGDRVVFRDSVDVAAGATARVNVVLAPPDAEGLAPPTSPKPALAVAPAAIAPPAGPPVLASPSLEPALPRTEASDETSTDRPVWKRWWFWTAVGAAAAAGTATVWILKSRSDCTGAGTTVCNNAMF